MFYQTELTQAQRWFSYRDQALASARAVFSQTKVDRARAYHKLGMKSLRYVEQPRVITVGCSILDAEFKANGFVNTMGD